MRGNAWGVPLSHMDIEECEALKQKIVRFTELLVQSELSELWVGRWWLRVPRRDNTLTIWRARKRASTLKNTLQVK